MFIDQNGILYLGDMQSGDREATAAEVAAWNASRAQLEVNSKLAKVREVREAILNRLAGIAGRATRSGDTALASACDAAALALLDLPAGCPTDPALVDAFITNKYAGITATLPLSLKLAFAGVDA